MMRALRAGPGSGRLLLLGLGAGALFGLVLGTVALLRDGDGIPVRIVETAPAPPSDAHP